MSSDRRPRLALVFAIYLLGIFMGAIDTGIVAPARVIIQNTFGVSEQAGIWIITGYSLAYAASIPVMGKIADRIGRKRVYIVAITLFGLGSLLCGLSEHMGGFGMLVAARIIQAIGGGGIMPIATAEFGTEVPPEKRGLALGLVGGVYGIANILGSSAGSLILDIVGVENWQWIFYVNVPISVAIVASALVFLPNHRASRTSRIDLVGIAILVVMITSLLYGLGNIDIFDLGSSIRQTDVYPFVGAFLLLLPLFVLAERRAADPVMNLSYFRTPAIAATLGIAFLTGIVMMGMVFVPQFAENAMHQATGKGGYWVMLLGVASGVGAPMSGRLTDRYGPRAVLAFGFVVSILSMVLLVGWAIPQPSLLSVGGSLAMMGLGLGFVIGSPLNYMMLAHTRPEESNSALASLSLVRAVGITLAPAIMVGFLAHAGQGMQSALLDHLPKEIPAPTLPYAAELDQKFTQLQSDEKMRAKLAGVTIPKLSEQKTVTIDMSSGSGLPADLVDLLRTADVTTITDRTKTVASRMFDANTPATIADIQKGVQQGIDAMASAVPELDATLADMATGISGMTDAIAGMNDGIAQMSSGIDGMANGIDGMNTGIAGMTSGITGMGTAIAKMDTGLAGMDSGLAGMKTGIDQQTGALTGMQSAIAGQQAGLDGMDAALAQQAAALAGTQQLYAMLTAGPPIVVPPGSTLLDVVPPAVRTRLPAAAQAQLATMTSVADLQTAITGLQGAMAGLQAQRTELATAQAQLKAGAAQLGGARTALVAQRAALQQQRDALLAARTNLAKQRNDLVAQRSALIRQRNDLTKQRADLIQARTDLVGKLAEVTQSRADLTTARTEVSAARDDLIETVRKMTVLRDAVPGAFQQAQRDYLAQIDARGPQLEATFQSTLNGGFRDIYLTTGIVCVLAMGLLLLYPARRRDEERHGIQVPVEATLAA